MVRRRGFVSLFEWWQGNDERRKRSMGCLAMVCLWLWLWLWRWRSSQEVGLWLAGKGKKIHAPPAFSCHSVVPSTCQCSTGFSISFLPLHDTATSVVIFSIVASPFESMRAVSLRRDFCRDRLVQRYFGQRFISIEGADEVGQSSKLRIFDRDLKRKQRDRAAWLMRPKDSLVDTVAENLLDRLEDCKRTFSTGLCMGGSLAAIRRLLRGRGGIEKLIMMDTSKDMLKSCQDSEKSLPDESLETTYIVGDEEFLPIKESSVDLIISSLGLHWTNDLPGTMIQSRLALKPDGLFLAAIFGGETLKELRIACTVAQMEREGGISPRLSPLAQVRDAGNLLTRAGFALPSVDVDEYTVRYRNSMDLIDHLRAMGETNALFQSSKILKRETAIATAAVYDSMFAAEDGSIPATYQVIYMTGWKEHASQQKAKRRGSATVSFKDLQKQFGSDETS